jgi:hypothetical protein
LAIELSQASISGTFWGGERESSAYYKGQFSKDGNTFTGSWVYPGGGKYEAISTKIK